MEKDKTLLSTDFLKFKTEFLNRKGTDYTDETEIFSRDGAKKGFFAHYIKGGTKIHTK